MAETETEKVSRSQVWKHQDFVEWATEEGLLDAKAGQAETIAVFAANRNAYRKTERYRTLVDSHKEEATAAAAERKEAAAKARAEKAAEREAAKAEKAAAKETAKEAETTKAPAKAAAPAKKTAAKKAAAKASEENPFD